MIKIYCPICGKDAPYTVLYKENFSKDLISEYTFSARRLPDRIHYRIVRCHNCGLIYSNPVLENQKIVDFYKKSKMNYQKELDDLKETYRYYLEKFIAFLPVTDNLLEVGCGNGFFLEQAQKVGFKNVFGVEPSIEAVNQAPESIRKNIVIDVLKQDLFQNNFFDIICVFQTFDHISDPNSFLNECHKYLKKDGLILMINHNIGAWTAKLLGERCPMIDIEHPFLYDKKTFSRIVAKNNFQVEKIFDVKNKYALYYWIRLIPLPKFFKQILLKIFSWSIMEKIKISINAGNMGIIAKKI